MLRRIIFICTLILPGFAGCNKNSLQNHLPAVTQKGAMTFGCILNGNYAFSVHGIIVSSGSGFASTCSGGVHSSSASDGLHMMALNCPDQTYTVFLDLVDSVVLPGTYNSGNGKPSNLMVLFQGLYGGIDTTIRYICDDTHGGVITITRASASDSIYSGTFSGTLTDGHNAYPVTDGRFDVKLD